MNFLSFQFTSLRSRDASSSSPRCSLFLDLQRKNGHPAAHTSQFPPVPSRRAPCVILLRPPLLPARRRRSQQIKNQPEGKKKNGDGEKAVDVSSLGKLVSGALPYSAKVMVGKVAPMQARLHSGRAAFRRVRY